MKKANKGVTAEDILASRIRPIASVSVREGGAFDHGDGVGEDDFLLWSGRLASDEARDGGQKGGLEAAADEAALSPFEDGLRLKFKNVVRVWGKRTFQIDEDNDFEARQRWMSLHRAEVAAAAQAQVTAAKEKGSGRGLGDKAARPGARAGTLASGSALRAATGGATGPLSGLGSSDQSEGFGNGREGVGEGGGGEMRVEDDFISNVTFGIDSLNPKIGPGVPKHWPLSLEVPLLRKIVCNENIIFLLTKQNELLCVGVADNGCLGLGEQQTLTREPARIHFVPSMFRSLPAPLDPAYSPFRTDPTVSSSLESPNNNSNPISGTAVSSGPAVPAGPLKPSPLPGISPAGSPGSPLSPGVSEVVDEVFGAELRMQREAQALGLTAPTIIDVVCGNAFALALSAEGRVYAWGAARFCGLATMHDIYTPTVLDHSLFDASISNAAAQNQQRPSSPKSPTSPASPTPAHIVAIGACGTMAAAMRNDGAFFLWGVLQGVAALSRPTLIGQFRNKNYRNFKIHCGLKFGLIRADDDLYQFGHGLNHEILTQPQTADTQQFARFAPAVSSYLYGFCPEYMDLRFWGIETKELEMVACGYEHVLLLTKRWRLYAYGANAWGQCGVGSRIARVSAPTLISTPSRPVFVAASARNSAYITQRGELFVWGDSSDLKTINQAVAEDMAKPLESLKETSAHVAELAAAANSSLGVSRIFGPADAQVSPKHVFLLAPFFISMVALSPKYTITVSGLNIKPPGQPG